MQIKENIKAPRHWPLCGEFTGDRWIPRTKGQLRGKCFHLITSSCYVIKLFSEPMEVFWQMYASFRIICTFIYASSAMSSVNSARFCHYNTWYIIYTDMVVQFCSQPPVAYLLRTEQHIKIWQPFLPKASLGLRVLSLHAFVCVCVRPSECPSLACPREYSSPLQIKATKVEKKTPWLRIPLIFGLFDPDFKVQIQFQNKEIPYLELVHAITHHIFK